MGAQRPKGKRVDEEEVVTTVNYVRQHVFEFCHIFKRFII